MLIQETAKKKRLGW